MNTCNLCPLSLQCLSPVLKTEVKKCDILIVCDQPDSKADFEGEPFAGPLGNLMRSLLEKAGIHPDEYNAVYAVKCSLRGYRETLSLVSIEACRSYLKEENHCARPRIIFALGNVSVYSVTGKQGIRNNIGTELSALPELNTDAAVVPLYSLEYIAQSPHVERTVVSILRKYAGSKKQDVIKWSLWDG
jgi:uracil-DNA glycosylase family 4